MIKNCIVVSFIFMMVSCHNITGSGNMVSKESEIIKDLYKNWVDTMAMNPDMTLEETRRMFEHWGDITSEPEGVDYIEVDANGVRCMWAKPKGSDESRALLCTHGGGYLVGSMYSHRKMFGHIAKAVGCPALPKWRRRVRRHRSRSGLGGRRRRNDQAIG